MCYIKKLLKGLGVVKENLLVEVYEISINDFEVEILAVLWKDEKGRNS